MLEARVRSGWGQVAAGEGMESESFSARGLPGGAEVGGIDRSRGSLQGVASGAGPCQPVKVGAEGVSFFPVWSPGFASLTPATG